MTGFAALSREQDGVALSVTIKSVNHRFLDVQVKAPGALGALEGRLKTALQQRLTRGRVEVQVSMDDRTEPEREVRLNEGLIARVHAVVDQARAQGLVTGALTVSDLLRIPHAVEIGHAAPPAGAAPVSDEHFDALVDQALSALIAMRETEGAHLAQDLDARLQTLLLFVDTVERAAAEGQAALEMRLRERLAGLPADLQQDPAAVTQEIVRFVARSDIHEEITRLRGHVEHWRGLAAGPEPCGRKLDFLVQEMNREINTIGSKAEGLTSTELVVNAKAELERVREQVQNVE
jgi:uncharacterized protein (TIGR00255 family)